MFFDILFTFFKFFLVFFLFIIAFGLGFHVLLNDKESWNNVGNSFIKTGVMMIGEFEYESIFYDGVLKFPVTTQVFFVAFMIIMSIIVMNLLVGLAVEDIKAVQEQAILKRLVMQVDLVLEVERSLPNFMRKYFLLQKENVVESGRKWWYAKFFTDVVSSRNILKDVMTANEQVSNLFFFIFYFPTFLLYLLEIRKNRKY